MEYEDCQPEIRIQTSDIRNLVADRPSITGDLSRGQKPSRPMARLLCEKPRYEAYQPRTSGIGTHRAAMPAPQKQNK